MNMYLRIAAFIVVVLLGLAPGAGHAAAPTITSFAPNSGPLGSKVTITGTGFTGATAVQFDGVTASFTVNSATQISGTVPATGTGAISVTTGGVTGTSSAAFTVTPSLSLSQTIGHESLAITVTGAGFAPYNAVDLYFDITDEALAVSNNLGVVSIQFQIPATAQPGGHWITLVDRGNDIAAQHAFTVSSNWAMQGWGPTNAGFNPFENTLTTGNVGQLDAFWTKPDGLYGNSSPLIEVNGSIYTGNVLGQILNYSATGTLLWTASPSGADFESSTPAANGSLIFFGSGSSVYAYKLACRTDGGVCAPTWTATLPANVAASLTVFNGTLYIPGTDGNIYPINPSTGTVGTPFAAYNSSTSSTSQVTFSIDGGYYYAEGYNLAYRNAYGGSGTINFSTIVSAPAVSNNRVYFTTGDGTVHRLYAWSASTSGTDCAPPPVVAYHLVYAGGCSTIGAYEAGNGAVQWKVTTNGPVLGLSVANGVLYGCVVNYYGGGDGELVAYDATYGALLWSGGYCTGAPVVVNGSVYAALGYITRYALPQTSPTYVRPRPAPGTLTPNRRLVPQHTPDMGKGW
jgi:outer membrane protein assembly factor BamB